MANEQKVIATAGLIAVGVGTANSIYKQNRLPSARFLIGSGVAFLALSMLSEGEPEVAKALAMAVATTVVLGEGGGLLTYINHHGEIDTQKSVNGHPTPLAKQAPKKLPRLATQKPLQPGDPLTPARPANFDVPGLPSLYLPPIHTYKSDAVPAFPGQHPTSK